MKDSARLLPLTTLPLIASSLYLNAAPMVSIGDSTDIFFVGSVTGRYESNVFYAENDEQDDFIWVLSPGLEMNIGRNSNFNVSVLYRHDFNFYNDLDSQDTDLANLFVNSSYQSGPLTTEAGLSFVQQKQNTERLTGAGVIGDLVERDRYNAFIGGEYDFSAKIFMEGRFQWDRTEFNNFTNVYTDRDSYSVPLNVLYRWTEKTSVGLGYRFRYQEVHAADDGTPGDNEFLDNFFNVAVRGEIAPKLQSRFNVGVQNRYNDNLDDDELSFSVLSEFIYDWTPKTQASVSLNRDFDVGGTGSSLEETGINAGIVYAFSEMVQSRAGLSYSYADYTNTNREDDTIRANLGVSYTPNNYVQFSAGYFFTTNDSSVTGASFDAHTLNFSATLRY